MKPVLAWHLCFGTMELIKRLQLALIFIAFYACGTKMQKASITDFSGLIQPTSKTSVLAEDGYYVWGGSVTSGNDGKYYLYYMGNTGNGKAMENLNFTHRNKQRIGVAWANNPHGPWYINDKPFINVSTDENGI